MKQSTSHEQQPEQASLVTHAGLARRVLVLLAGRSLSVSPVLHAVMLAEQVGGEVQVAVQDPALGPAMLPFSRTEAAVRWAADADAARGRSLEQLNRDARSAARHSGVSVSVMGPIGSPAWLKRNVRRSSLVVLHRGDHSAALGDAVVAMTRDLLQRARRPVLVVPPAHHEPVRVTAAFAGKELGPRVLRTAASLARGLDLPLTVYTAGPPAERERAAREARRVLTDLTPGIFQGCGGRAVEALLEQCRPRTLLVMGAFGSWSVRRLVMGSVSEKVMRGALGPVLLVHRSMRDKAE